jgi:hypothetical protein
MTGGSTSGPENCAKRLNDESQQEQRHWFARRRYQRFPVGQGRALAHRGTHASHQFPLPLVAAHRLHDTLPEGVVRRSQERHRPERGIGRVKPEETVGGWQLACAIKFAQGRFGFAFCPRVRWRAGGQAIRRESQGRSSCAGQFTRPDFLMHYTKLIAPGKAPGGDHVGPMIAGFLVTPMPFDVPQKVPPISFRCGSNQFGSVAPSPNALDSS